MHDYSLDRRRLVRSALALGSGTAASLLLPGWARAHITHGDHTMPTADGAPGHDVLDGDHIELAIARTPFTLGGKTGHAVTVNGTLPAPLIRLREGQMARISVTNHLDEDSSIHGHGILLPFQMDGVPGVSFPGIRPHKTFTYEFPVRQAGTYWYHSHSGLQEAIGLSDRVLLFSARPGRIKDEYAVTIERPREIETIVTHDAYNELFVGLWRSLKEEIVLE